MIRAGVFIGVDKTGGLQKLNDAAAGARRMHQWALDQGMPDITHAKLITDENGQRVTPDRIFDAIKAILDGPGVDQLIVYFAGHGVNINRSEHWLLTDAPGNAGAAVDLRSSVELAQYSGIGHAVFISDACRVAPEGIQAQNVRGQDIFPNESVSDKAQPVDRFFACGLGKTAAEIKDAAVAATTFSALYTSVLLDGLSGTEADLLEPSSDPTDKAWYVRPGRLEAYLVQQVPRRVVELGLQKKVHQEPDAILSLHTHWISRVISPAKTGSFHFGPELLTLLPASPRSMTRTLLRAAAQGDKTQIHETLDRAKDQPTQRAHKFAQTIERVAATFGPDQFETQCGFKIRGGTVVRALSSAASANVLDSGQLVRIDGSARPTNVVLQFADGRGAVIPAIPGFIAALTFDEDRELADVVYEPSANSWRWSEYKDRAAEVRALRAVAATASQYGHFRLQSNEALQIASKMQYAKLVDPTFSIYAAYAYYDLQALDRIREMSGYLKGNLGFTFFDLALLSRQLVNKTNEPSPPVMPSVPLLAQGWSLLRANRVQLPAALSGLENTLVDSLWSLYTPNGVEKLVNAMTQEVRP